MFFVMHSSCHISCSVVDPWIWIQIYGSVPLTNGPDPDPAIFVLVLKDANKKKVSLPITF
jgi:hypothetical protein